MFYGCILLVTPPELPATKLAESCYSNMFRNCTSLTRAPELPATNIQWYYCYEEIFRNCVNLKYIKVGFSTWHDNFESTLNWVADITESGTFDAPEELPIEFGVNRIPSGWNVLNAKPYLKAEDQNMLFSTILEFTKQIKYEVYPSDAVVTFEEYNGYNLPFGLTLETNTGIIRGYAEQEGTYTSMIKLSAPDCEDVIITLTIEVTSNTSFTTPHNLTSNDSNADYIVSQSSDLEDKRHAWNAMDGSLNEEYGCSHTNIDNNQWWKIKFVQGPVQVTKITWTNRTGGIDSYLSNPYKIQGSNDDSDWTTMHTINDMTSGSEAVHSWEIDDPYGTKYQYWRILQEGFSYLIIGEIEFEYSL